MIKILILLIVFIFLAFLLNFKIENFSNVNLKCGLEGSGIIISNLGNVVSGGSGSGSSGGSGSGSSGGSGIGSNNDITPNVNTQVQLVTVNPLLPECIGICINQHTYTKENTKDIFIPNPNIISQKKSNQSDSTIMTTKCGECINNFYKGLEAMMTQHDRCNL